MTKFDYTKLFLYRWRYWIGYFIIASSLIGILIFIASFIPGGISNQEIQSVIKSSSYNLADMKSMNLLNFPYYLLQHASIAILGVTILSIKLPSIIISFFSIIGLVIILKLWFKPSIGILASLIAITTGQFLFIAQNGTTDIMYLFWAVCLLLIASLIPLQQKFRKPLILSFFITASLSLYTPLSIYILVVIAGSILLHPHLRYVIKKLSKVELLIGGLTIAISVTPLIISIINSPKLGLQLLGIPEHFPNLFNNIIILGSKYLNFTNPGGGPFITPFFELGSMLIIVIGLYYVLKTSFTAKSYVVILWTACLVPIIVLNPDLTTITFMPLVLLLAYGLNGLMNHWYALFPRNPYARVGGLIPIVILVSVLLLSGLNRYIYGYKYDPNIVPKFSNDISLIPRNTTNILVDSSEFKFYNVIAKYNKKISISSTLNTETFLATRKAMKSVTRDYKIEKIITTSNANDADRFYLYKKITD